MPRETRAGAQPRALGRARLTARPRGGATRIGDLHQAGALKLLFPRVTGAAMQAVLVNTAGGVTGGDRFALEARAEMGADFTLTTQAAERAYRAQPGETGRIRTTLSAAQGARLTWMPQETILFQGAALDRTITVDLDPEARLLFCEPLVFGRRAMGETLTDAALTDRVEIRRGGQALYLDQMRFAGDIAAHLARPTIASGAAALASLVYVAPDAEAHLAPIRAMLGPTAGASLLAPDTLVLRALAEDSFVLRQTLMPILTRLSGGDLPRPWMI